MKEFHSSRKLSKIVSAGFSSIVIAGMASNLALADPLIRPTPDFPLVFCFRFTDIERVAGDVEGDAFILEFEVLNWTGTDAFGLSLGATVGTSSIAGDGVDPVIVQNGIDANGRGGPLGGSDIPSEPDPTINALDPNNLFDPVAIHSGRGRGDLGPEFHNDWVGLGNTGTTALWDGRAGTAIPNRDLLGTFAAGGDARALVPGGEFTQDALGDTAIDGGPGPYSPNDGPPFGPFGGPPVPDGSGNVLDGFTLTIDDFDEGEILSFNWFLLDENLQNIGVSGQGNDFGFGTVNLQRSPLGVSSGPALFGGNTGLNQSSSLFFDNVFLTSDPGGEDFINSALSGSDTVSTFFNPLDPEPANFLGELSAGTTAAFLNPNDQALLCSNGCPVNFTPVPEPITIMGSLSAIGFGAYFRKRRTQASK